MFSRKSIFAASLLVFVLLWSETNQAQSPFRGRITYHISYPGSMIDLAELEELPGKAEIVTKNNLVRTELTGENISIDQVKIADGENKEVATLLEILREKYVIRKDYSQIQADLREMPQVELEYTNETKEIEGYTCRKVIARTEDDMGNEYESVIYYTDEIPGDAFNFDTPYHEIPGLMLEYEMRVGPLNIRYEVQSIRSRWIVWGRNFRVPRDYQETTYEELRSYLQGDF